MAEHEHVTVDGESARVQGHLDTADMEAFTEVVRAAKEHARAQPPTACRSPRCDYDEPHNHGFECGPRCLCGQGMQAVELTHWVGDAPTSLHGNGAASFDRTTRDPAGVTCALCQTMLARELHDPGSSDG